MKISMKFLQNRLSDRKSLVKLNGLKNPFFESIQFYTDGSVLERGVLYFCSSQMEGDSFSALSAEKDCGIVWVDLEREPPSGIPVLQIKEEVDLWELFNEISGIFAFYHKWSYQVYQAVLERQSLKKLFQLLTIVTPNPWYLADSSFRIQVIKKDEDMSAIWKFQYKQRHLPIHVILNLVESGELDIMNKKKHAFIPNTNTFNIPFVSKTIFSSKGILGHFYILGVYSRLSEYEIEIAEFFGNVLTEMLVRDNTYLPTLGRFYDNYFIDLIEKTTFENIEVLGEVFRILSWKSNDRFCIAILKRRGKDSLEKTVSGLEIHVLESSYPCKAFLYHDNIVAVFNLRKMQKEQIGYEKTEFEKNKFEKNEFEKDMQSVLQNFGGCAGYSEQFQGLEGFHDFSIFYQQASIALQYALMDEKQIAVCGYQAIVMQYLCSQIRDNMSIRLIYHHALSILHRYDKENNTDFSGTLYQYLVHEQNTVQTAKALFIHRNSLMYRLEKIRQLTNLDLSDAEVRVRLMISFYLPDPEEASDERI